VTAWLLLACAISLELVGTFWLKLSDGITKLAAVLAMGVCWLASFGLLGSSSGACR
jgi:multidrug transporter EmrE-like cation transporter